MDKTLESGISGFSRIAFDLYQRATFLRNCHYGPGNASYLHWLLGISSYQSHTSRILSYYKSKNIHSFKHNFPALTLYQAGAGLLMFEVKNLRLSHRPAHHNKYLQTDAQALPSDFFNLRKKISMSECKCKVIHKRKNFLPYTLKMIFQTPLMGHTMRPINQSIRKRTEPSSI